jgi:hypothetical protein
MLKEARKAYLLAIKKRYREGDRAAKKLILDEFCEVCGYARKYAIRILNESRKNKSRQKKSAGRRPQYDDPKLMAVIKKIWFASDQPCGKRLKAAIPVWLPYYEDSYGAIQEPIRGQLLTISAATLDRLLKATRVKNPKGLTGTKPGSLLKSQIPIRTHFWDESLPGFVEADTVAHCGNSLAGNFVWSLVMTDIVTGWTEARATWNKGSGGVLEQIKDIETHLPFPLRGFDCDNGSEFLNHHLVRYFTEHPNKPAMTRSRPYRKNDNAHVEQKNWTHARQLFGYDRIGREDLVPLMNELYRTLWCPLQNHFCPSLKLKEKSRDGSRYVRRYHAPMTPYERVMAHAEISDEIKTALREQHAEFNPFKLKAAIERKLKVIFSHIPVSSIVRQRI